MAQITVTLSLNEKKALAELSDRTKRDPRKQAAMLICQGLERAGVLPSGGLVEEKQIYGIWVEDNSPGGWNDWHYGGSKVFSTDNLNLALAQYLVCKRLYLDLDCVISVCVIGPDGLPLGSSIQTSGKV